MLRIIATDNGDSFDLDVAVSGEVYIIAQELNAALTDLAKNVPEVIDCLTHMKK